MNMQSSAVDIPSSKATHIIASTTPDGHTMMSSTVTDEQGRSVRRNSLCADTGISPKYYTSNGSMIQTSRQTDDVNIIGSPVYGDQSRIFFSHHSNCSCRGSGVGCDCAKECVC